MIAFIFQAHCGGSEQCVMRGECLHNTMHTINLHTTYVGAVDSFLVYIQQMYQKLYRANLLLV